MNTSKSKGNRGHKKNDLIARNVVIIPPEDVWNQMVELSKSLAELYRVEFALGKGNLPHISQYQTSYPRREASNLTLRVRQIAAETSPFVVTLADFGTLLGEEAPAWQTFVFWDVQPSRPLRTLHQTLLDQLAPFRHQELLPVHQQIMQDPTVPLEYKRSLELYGTMLAGKTERPHFTLSRLSSAVSVPAALEYLQTQRPTKPLRFEVKEICITDVGKNGTCNTILETFPLGGSS